jgi:hypothetical protein
MKMEETKKCPLFPVCGAEVIHEKLDRSRAWQNQYCSGDFEKCVHFEARKQNVQAISE